MCCVGVTAAEDLAGELVRTCTFGQPEKVKQLLDKGAGVNVTSECGRTPLREAAAKGRLGIARLLLEPCAEVDAANSAGETALYIAAGRDHPEIVELLFAKGANPNIKTCERSNAFNKSQLQRLCESCSDSPKT